MKRPTLKEVAQLAGVSTATVSHVLNNSKYVTEEVRKKVISAADTLNYRVNTVAKSLREQKSRLIGVLISDIANPFFSVVVRGIEQELNKNNYHILLCNSDSDVEKEREYVEVLIGKRIDGLIVSSSGNTGDYFKSLKQTGVPIIFLNRCPKFMNSDVIMTNNMKGAYTAVEHFIQHHYANIGIISGPQNVSTGRDRLTGYKRALEDYGYSLQQNLIKEGNFDILSGYEKMQELMSQDVKPDAVFVSNNFMTLGAYKFLKEKRIRIPKEVAIIGFDDPEWAEITDPPVTTIGQPAFEQGVQAAKLITARIQDSQSRREILYMDPSLNLRQSCGCNEAEKEQPLD